MIMNNKSVPRYGKKKKINNSQHVYCCSKWVEKEKRHNVFLTGLQTEQLNYKTGSKFLLLTLLGTWGWL